MSVVQFDRDAMARSYADRHLRTDPGIVEIHYLPANATDREIRLVEVNSLIATRIENSIEPLDFGVDTGAASKHTRRVVRCNTPIRAGFAPCWLFSRLQLDRPNPGVPMLSLATAPHMTNQCCG